ncbi:MAG TPA: VOC family protein [Edaphobacter sp.]|jgi:PhnB protein|nr:VOC family protein [Edaphobacter sp.]
MPISTTIAPFLSVRNSAKAVEFYKSAFGAIELLRVEDSGSVLANLSVDGAGFWVSDKSPEHQNLSPETLNGGTVRMILTTDDPDAAFQRAVDAGATIICQMTTEHAWRIGRVVDPFGHHWEIGKPLR